YSIRENKWMTFENTLPSPLYDCVAIWSEEDNSIHFIGGGNSIRIIGGGKDNDIEVSTHMKTKVRLWDSSQLSKKETKFIIQYWIQTSKIKLGWIDDFDKIILKYSVMK
ncbi:hypothetical protein RFI_39004, partial [Reticulomyxa filosa]